MYKIMKATAFLIYITCCTSHAMENRAAQIRELSRRWVFEDNEAYIEKIQQLKLLISHEADINEVDKCGYTALMNAADSGNFQACELLIKAGADVYRASNGNATALSLASGVHLFLLDPSIYQRICELLVEAMLYIPDKVQKQSMRIFLGSLRRYNETTPGVYDRDIRQLFKESFPRAIRAQNSARALEEVYKLPNGSMKQYLLQKYFPNHPSGILAAMALGIKDNQ